MINIPMVDWSDDLNSILDYIAMEWFNADEILDLFLRGNPRFGVAWYDSAPPSGIRISTRSHGHWNPMTNTWQRGYYRGIMLQRSGGFQFNKDVFGNYHFVKYGHTGNMKQLHKMYNPRSRSFAAMSPNED